MKPYEINELVAEKVLGYEVRDGCLVWDNKRSGIPPYSTDIKWAWEIVEKMQELHHFSLSDLPSNGTIQYVAEFSRFGGESSWVGIVGNTAPLAICKAALKVVGVEV